MAFFPDPAYSLLAPATSPMPAQRPSPLAPMSAPMPAPKPEMPGLMQKLGEGLTELGDSFMAQQPAPMPMLENPGFNPAAITAAVQLMEAMRYRPPPMRDSFRSPFAWNPARDGSR